MEWVGPAELDFRLAPSVLVQPSGLLFPLESFLLVPQVGFQLPSHSTNTSSRLVFRFVRRLIMLLYCHSSSSFGSCGEVSSWGVIGASGVG